MNAYGLLNTHKTKLKLTKPYQVNYSLHVWNSYKSVNYKKIEEITCDVSFGWNDNFWGII